MQQASEGVKPNFRARIIGSGSYVPKKTITNDDLAQMVDTSDEWITTRTGIKSRHISSDSESTAMLASKAAQQALEDAQVSAADVDLVLVATITPEMGFPSTACFVQQSLAAKNAWAFDISAACSGFVYGLVIGQQFIETGQARTVLVIGAETMTKVMDWEDRASCILFGDGAGAVVLQRSDDLDYGILFSSMGADGNGWKYLNCQAYGSRHPANKPLDDPKMIYMSIRGREIYQQAVRQIVDSVNECMEKCNLTLHDLDMLIPHQMNARIIESAAKRLRLPEDKVFVNISEYGNTSAASVPIALHECRQQRLIQPGNIVITVAFGAGLTWGANVIRI